MYSYLRDAFEEFVYLKSGKMRAQLNALDGLKQYREFNHRAKASFYELLGLSPQELNDTFLAPWRRLNQEQISALARFWNLQLLLEKNMSLHAEAEYSHQALHWTLVNVVELNLFDVFLPNAEAEFSADIPFDQWDWITRLFVSAEYAMPYHQCLYCGRLDNDPRGRAFGKKLIYCHVDGCPTASNASEHVEGCCYKAWAKKKEALQRQCQRANDNPNKVRTSFLSFCEKRYLENMALTIPVRPQKEKPPAWRHVYDPTG
jgi:hypothetical protein